MKILCLKIFSLYGNSLARNYLGGELIAMCSSTVSDYRVEFRNTLHQLPLFIDWCKVHPIVVRRRRPISQSHVSSVCTILSQCYSEKKISYFPILPTCYIGCVFATLVNVSMY